MGILLGGFWEWRRSGCALPAAEASMGPWLAVAAALYQPNPAGWFQALFLEVQLKTCSSSPSDNSTSFPMSPDKLLPA